MHSLASVWFAEIDPTIEVKLKQCLRCKVERRLEEFRIDNSQPDGLNRYCKPCMKVYHAEYKEKHSRVFDVSVGSKACKKCGEVKLYSDFYPHKRNVDGLGTYCKPCHNKRCAETKKRNKTKLLNYCSMKYQKSRHKGEDPHQRSAEWRAFKDKQLRRTFGIGIEDFLRMWDEQKGCCATCGKHYTEQTKDLAVDHDHATGQVRKLLCHHCNAGIGHANEDTEVMQSWIDYVNEFKTTLVKTEG